MLKKFDRARYDALLYRDFSVHYGKVNKVVGLTVESVGPPAKLNDLCEIISKDGLTKVMAEVVGFRENKVLLMPYDSVDGIGLGATVRNTEVSCRFRLVRNCLARCWMASDDRWTAVRSRRRRRIRLMRRHRIHSNES